MALRLGTVTGVGHARLILERYLAPAAGYVMVLARGDLARLSATSRGRYVQRHMPASMQATGFAGDAVMTVAAACRRLSLLALAC